MKTAVNDFAEVRDLLKEKDPPPARMVWPTAEELSLEEVATRLKLPALEILIRNLELALLVGSTPVIAIAGELKGGKTSLVASFLTEESAQRLNRGHRPADATHRFTLWVPASWMEDPEVAGLVRQELRVVFGCVPDDLAPDPSAARKQQQDRSRLMVPLLAADRQLDELALALLDCPDIQSAGDTEKRVEALRRASAICAGQLVVVEHRKLSADIVGKVGACLPKARTFAAINFSLSETPNEIAGRFQRLHPDLEVCNDDIYVAFDFTHRDYEKWAPDWDPNREILDQDGWEEKARPCFFQALPDTNGDAGVDIHRSLRFLADRVRPEELEHTRSQARREELLKNFAVLADSLDEAVRNHDKRIAAKIEELARAIHSFIGDDLIMTRAVTISMKNVVLSGVPRPLRPFVRTGRLYTAKLLHDIKTLFKRPPTRETRTKGRHASDLLKIFVKVLGLAKRDAQRTADAALERFVQEDPSNLTSTEWKRVIAHVWEGMSAMEKVSMTVALIVAAIIEVLVFAGDGGTVIVTVFGVVTARVGLRIMAAIKDLKLERILGQQNANFIAICLDELGLPRLPVLKEQNLLSDPVLDALPDPTIPVRSPSDAPFIPVLDGESLVTIDKRRVNEITDRARAALTA